MTSTEAFQPRHRDGRLLGYSLEHEHVLFFFGAAQLDRPGLVNLFPEYEFCFLKQVHGHAVVPADPSASAEADAHFTRRPTRAPVVQTADCMPVLLASRHQVCAVHAGWRGVEQNIIAATASIFHDDPVLFAALGPHILRNSFEVDADVGQRLLAAAPCPLPSAVKMGAVPGKAHVDLSAIVEAQLRLVHGDAIAIFSCLYDTKTSPEFHSFRRQGSAAGRQFSFVVLNS
jgi:YfiH family protein